LKPDLSKEIILYSIRKALKVYHFNLSYIEFVGNHVHIIIKTLHGGAPISRIMQYIKARITRLYNDANDRTGTLWNERYKSEIIEDYYNPVVHFIKLIIKLSYNPVRRGLYQDPMANPYSSLHIYLNQHNKKRIPLKIHEYFCALGKCKWDRINSFRYYEELYIAK
jgi:putative transposase